MTTQTTLFPKTELDEATAVLAHLITEEEKADKASDAADQKVADTASRVRKQRHVVARLQAMMPAAEPIAEGEVVSDDVEDAEVLQIEGDVLDPITGEVVGKEALAEGLEPVADAMLEDLKDEGVIAEPYVSVVIVLYPGSDEPVVTKIGDRTRYGELVADYFTAAGLNGKHDAGDWQVKGEDDGFVRKLRDIIGGSDHGKRLIVEMTPEAAIARDNAKVGAA